MLGEFLICVIHDSLYNIIKLEVRHNFMSRNYLFIFVILFIPEFKLYETILALKLFSLH